jgi:hypothetical protein
MTEEETPIKESDEVAGYQYRLAQARRLTRYCESLGLDPDDVSADQLAPILNDEGKIVPEAVDYEF